MMHCNLNPLRFTEYMLNNIQKKADQRVKNSKLPDHENPPNKSALKDTFVHFVNYKNL